MKKKFLAIFIIAMVSLSCVACSNDNKKAEEPADQKIEENISNSNETEVSKTEEKEDINENLEGIDLINSMDNKRPEKLMIKSEMTSYGTTTKVATYYNGDMTRTEMDVPGMAKSISIFLPNESVIYSYVYGETEGVKMIGANTTYAEEMGLMVDNSDFLTEVVEESSRDVIARVEKLEGEEVIYIEATETDEEIGDVLVKMWYSKKYGTPLKYEVAIGEKTMMQLNVTEISDNVNIDESLFVPPSDVNFEEMSMEKMMENW